MFISDMENNTATMGKTALVYLLAALFSAVFGAVYESFSHEVYSGYMIYAFLIPLAGGTLPFLCMSVLPCRHIPGRVCVNLYHCGIAALTVGCIFQGVLDIYGTTNKLIWVYWIVGFGQAGAGILLYGAEIVTSRRR